MFQTQHKRRFQYNVRSLSSKSFGFGHPYTHFFKCSEYYHYHYNRSDIIIRVTMLLSVMETGRQELVLFYGAKLLGGEGFQCLFPTRLYTVFDNLLFILLCTSETAWNSRIKNDDYENDLLFVFLLYIFRRKNPHAKSILSQ